MGVYWDSKEKQFFIRKSHISNCVRKNLKYFYNWLNIIFFIENKIINQKTICPFFPYEFSYVYRDVPTWPCDQFVIRQLSIVSLVRPLFPSQTIGALYMSQMHMCACPILHWMLQRQISYAFSAIFVNCEQY